MKTKYVIEDPFPFRIKRRMVWGDEIGFDSIFIAQYNQSKIFVEYYKGKLETQGKKKHPKLRNKIKKHQDKMRNMKLNNPEEFI